MQTFLPYPRFAQSAKVLDDRRLGKQRLECLQILRTILLDHAGWGNHPACIMWKNAPHALGVYYSLVCREWETRSFQQNMWTPYAPDCTPEFLRRDPPRSGQSGEELYHVHWPPLNQVKVPHWWNDDRLHSSHRSALLRKLPEHYSLFGWTDDPAATYYWPGEKA